MAVLAIVAVMGFGLTACGSDDPAEGLQEAANEVADVIMDSASDSEDSTTDNADQGSVDMSTATEQEWGDYKISVPTGFEFQGGDVFDEKDTSVFSVKESTFKYFDFKIDDKKTGMQQYNYNKETYTNGQKDVSGTIGDYNWTGFQYEDGMGGYGFELYTENGDKVIRVSSCGYEIGSAVPEAIIASLHAK